MGPKGPKGPPYRGTHPHTPEIALFDHKALSKNALGGMGVVGHPALGRK